MAAKTLEIIIDLPIGFPINNIISLSLWAVFVHGGKNIVFVRPREGASEEIEHRAP